MIWVIGFEKKRIFICLIKCGVVESGIGSMGKRGKLKWPGGKGGFIYIGWRHGRWLDQAVLIRRSGGRNVNQLSFSSQAGQDVPDWSPRPVKSSWAHRSNITDFSGQLRRFQILPL